MGDLGGYRRKKELRGRGREEGKENHRKATEKQEGARLNKWKSRKSVLEESDRRT